MSYPRNAASPLRIAVGTVTLIADGTVQTSGCSVVVRPEGGAESAGAGTIAYSAASGIVYYTPTQAETDYTAFCVVAYKAACHPAAITVVTSASSVPGRTMPADGSITAAVIATDAIDADAIKADAVTEIQSGLATAANLATVAGYLDEEIAAILADTNELQTNWGVGGSLTLQLNSIHADVDVIIDGIGFITSVLMGACSDAGTAGETYVITFGGATYTVDYTGLDATGNRSTTTRTKT